jgi:hypothetical protein
MPTKAAKPPDQKRIIAKLAAKCRVSVGEMTPLYEAERAKLAKDAHITKFLDVFATRHVLESFLLHAAAAPVQAPAKTDRTGV